MTAFPQLHVSPPFGWMNDPNGLVWLEGEYHLFYQYHPFSTVWGPMHWGHAVSQDLHRWEHLPIALSPDALGTIFSGSVVHDRLNSSGLVPGGGLVAVFSYSTQNQGLAFSVDRGRTWEKYSGNPILKATAKDFRDPKVFAFGNEWRMVIAAGDHLEFYRSANLREWTITGRFQTEMRPGVWECPDLFPLKSATEEHWVLLLSLGDGAPAGGSGTAVFLGQYDGERFTPSGHHDWMDWGPDNYAGVTWNDAPDNQRLFVGWMNNWKYARSIPAAGWRGSMTIPRKLSLSDDKVPRIVQTPVVPAEVMVQEYLLRRHEIREVHIPLDSHSKRSVHLVWEVSSQSLRVSRRNAVEGEIHPDFGFEFSMPLRRDTETLAINVVVDHGSVEVFAQGQALTMLVFPEPNQLPPGSST